MNGRNQDAFALELRAEAHFGVVHGEVRDAAAELEEELARVPVALVLLHRVGDRLLGEAVFEFERGDRETVDEKAEIERELRLVAAVPKLPRHAEAVRGEALLRLPVARVGRAVEEVELVRPVLDAVS